MNFNEMFGSDAVIRASGNPNAANLSSNGEKSMDGLHVVEETDVFKFENVSLSYDNFEVFKDFNLAIKDFSNYGQFISILGQSGAGKSCLIKMLANLEHPQSGRILYYGKPLTEKDHFPMIFQQYSPFHWMTVLENVALPMKLKGVDKETRDAKAMKLLEIVGLKGHENKWANQPPLSGGQLQRVALARALATGSHIILMDEYSSGLDIVSKHAMQQTLLDVYYSSEVDPTFINVTHDVTEAVMLSNRIIILAANPCRVAHIIDIDFGPERRTSAIRQTEKFSRYVTQIEMAMEELNTFK